MKLLPLCVMLIFSLHCIGAEKLKVSIYSQSLCRHTQEFITTQFYPAYLKIGDYLDVEFVPYGLAKHTSENGEWVFNCVFGPEECYGNKLQVCALDQHKDQDEEVEFINCVMGSNDPSSDQYVKKCADQFNFSWTEIKSCADSSRGSDILAQYGDRTKAVSPKIIFIPTIIFNEKYDRRLNKQAELNFLRTACGLFEEKPDACN